MKTSLLLSFLFLIVFTSCKESTPKQKSNQVKTTSNLYTETYPSGQIKIKGALIKNTRQGVWVSYYENGNIWSETNYLNGKKNGQTKSYYSNGNLRFLGHYEEDNKTGQWFFYSENGQFQKEVDFTQNK